MAWFDDLKTPRIKTQVSNSTRTSKVPEGLWVKCSQCGEILQSKVLKDNLSVCPECSHHFRVGAADRIAMLTDEGSFDEYAEDLVSSDPLEFDDTKPYKARLRSAAGATGLRDAFVAGKAKIGGLPYHLGVFEFKFMGEAWAWWWAKKWPAFMKTLSRIAFRRSWCRLRVELGCRRGFCPSCRWQRPRA